MCLLGVVLVFAPRLGERSHVASSGEPLIAAAPATSRSRRRLRGLHLEPRARLTPRSAAEEAAFALLCRLKSIAPTLLTPTAYEIAVTIYAGQEMILLRSHECPTGTFSMLHVDEVERIRGLLDCRKDRPEAIALRTQMQGETVDVIPTPGKVSLAIQGPGHFIYRCADSLYLSRLGDLTIGRTNHLVSNGCRLLTTEGREFVGFRDDLDERGCAVDGQCVAVADEDFDGVAAVGPYTYRAITDPFAKLIENPRVIQNAREELDDERTEHYPWQRLPASPDVERCP